MSASTAAGPDSTRPASPSSPATLSWDTITAGTPCRRAQAPVQRSVVRSETSSRSGANDVNSAVNRRRLTRTRYPPEPGTTGPGSEITRPCDVCSST